MEIYKFRSRLFFRHVDIQIMNTWTSIKTRLPESHTDVLLFVKGFAPIVGYLLISTENEPVCWVLNDLDEYEEHFKLDDFTHWMPLPEEPQ